MLNRILLFFLVFGIVLVGLNLNFPENETTPADASTSEEASTISTMIGVLNSWIEKLDAISKADATVAGTGSVSPEELALIFQAGLDAYNSGDYETSIAEYDRYLSSAPNHSKVFYNRGLAKYNLERYSESESDFDSAFSLDEEDMLSLFYRGNSRIYLGRTEEGLTDLNDAIESGHLEQSYAYADRANALNKLNRYKEALIDGVESAKLDSQNENAYFAQAFAYYGLEKYKESIKSYDKVLKLNPKYPVAYYNRGLSYSILKKKDKACSDWKKALDLGYENSQEMIQENCK